MTSPNFFENLLASAPKAAGGFNEGLRVGLVGQGTTPAMAANGFTTAGKFLGGVAKFGALPGVAALGGALPGIMEGDLLEAGGGAAGGLGGALIAKAAVPALTAINPLLGIAGAVALPTIGSMIGQGIGNSLNQPAQAATNAIGNQINPSSMRNVAGGAAEDIEGQYKRLAESIGAENAAAYMRQALQMDKIDAIDENRSKRAIRMMPVRSAARLAELGTQGNIAMNLRAMDGTNQMLSNVTASNPYAQMLVA